MGALRGIFALFPICGLAQTYTISTFAGGGLPVNVPGTSASIGVVSGVAVDAAGNVYIASQYGNIVLRLDTVSGLLTLVAGNGTSGLSGDNGPAGNAQLNQPIGIAVDSAGNVYIADGLNSRIRKVSNGVITTVAGGGSLNEDNVLATEAQLSYPGGVAIDLAGNLYLTDQTNRVRRVSNGVITTVAGNGTPGFSGDGGPATSAQLYLPAGVALDSAGNLYIAERGNNRIRKVSNGVITTIAGNGAAGYSGDNGPAVSASLSGPFGVAVDPAGSLYIADTGNNVIRKVSNGTITTIAGDGMVGFAGDDGPAAGAQLNGPTSVAVDSRGRVYIADSNNNRIRLATPRLPRHPR